MAFSRRHNRITFLGVFEGYTYPEAGPPLLGFALNELDERREITSTVLKGSHPRLAEERQMYEQHGFWADGETTEAGATTATLPESTERTIAFKSRFGLMNWSGNLWQYYET